MDTELTLPKLEGLFDDLPRTKPPVLPDLDTAFAGVSPPVPEVDPFGMAPGMDPLDLLTGAGAGAVDLSMMLPKLIGGGLMEAGALPWNLTQDPSQIGKEYERAMQAFPIPWEKILTPEGEQVRQATALPFALPSMVMDPIAESVFESPQVDPMSGEVLSETQPELAAILKTVGEVAPLAGMVYGAGRSVVRGGKAGVRAAVEAIPEGALFKSKAGKTWTAQEVGDILRATDESTINPELLDAFKNLSGAEKSQAIKGAGIDIETVEPTWLGKLLGEEAKAPVAKPGKGKKGKPKAEAPAEPVAELPEGPAPAGEAVTPPPVEGPPPDVKTTTSTFGSRVAADAAVKAYEKNDYATRTFQEGGRWKVERWKKPAVEEPPPLETAFEDLAPVAPPSPPVPETPAPVPPRGPEEPKFVERRGQPRKPKSSLPEAEVGPDEIYDTLEAAREDLSYRERELEEEKAKPITLEQSRRLSAVRSALEGARESVKALEARKTELEKEKFQVFRGQWETEAEKAGKEIGAEIRYVGEEANVDPPWQMFEVKVGDQKPSFYLKPGENLAEKTKAKIAEFTKKEAPSAEKIPGVPPALEKAPVEAGPETRPAPVEGPKPEEAPSRGPVPEEIAKISSNKALTLAQGFEVGGTVYFKRGWNKDPLKITHINSEGEIRIEGSKATRSPTEFTKEKTEAGTEQAKPLVGAHPEALPRRPPSDRWTVDPGAIPGEPSFYLDDEADGAAAVILENEDGEFRAQFPDGRPITSWKPLEEVAAAAEKVVDRIRKREEEEKAPVPEEIALKTPEKGEKIKVEAPDEQVGEALRGKLEDRPAEPVPEAIGERPVAELPDRDLEPGDEDLRPTVKEDELVPSGERGGEDVPPAERGRPAEPRGVAPRKHGPRGINIAPDALRGSLAEAYKGGPKTRIKGNLEAIRTLKEIESEDRLATPDEQKVLSKYVGWGGLPQVFAAQYAWQKEGQEWKPQYDELAGMLTPEEMEAAQGSTINAHYTDPDIVGSIWKGLQNIGFEGPARILEPAAGIGHFIGLTPPHIQEKSTFTGVELDQISGRIARQLYQNSDIRVESLQDAKLPNNFYDLAISNVPFSDTKILEDREYRKHRFALHNYFFAKSLDKVRPGGIVAFISTHYTMDSKDSSVRDYLAERADLVGAIRLPNTAFKKNAGTEVVTDVLFLRKRMEGEPATGRLWTKSEGMDLPGKVEGARAWVNQYFVTHPVYVLGNHAATGSMYRGDEYTVEPHEGAKEGEALAELMDKKTDSWKSVYSRPVHKATEEADLASTVPAPDEIKEGAYYLEDGKLFQKEKGEGIPVQAEGRTFERFKGMVEVRDALRKLHRGQLLDSPDAELDTLRTDLNAVYDSFVKKQGYLHQDANANLFVKDPDSPLLLSTEIWDVDTEKATKADIFTKRTVFPYKRIEKVDTAQEALFVSLNELGRVDLRKMKALTGISESQLVQDLAGQVYMTPQGEWQTADEYLSGNVRKKLEEARGASQTDPDFQANVDALERVQPKDLTFTQIEVTLGSPWVPPEDVKEFVGHILGGRAYGIKVQHSAALGQWHIVAPGNLRNSVAATSTWGTMDYDAVDLIMATLNMRTVAVQRKDIDGKTYTDQEATIQARQKQQEVKDEFKKWIWSEMERRDRLHRFYNDEYNATRKREHDGSHLTLPGQAVGIELRRHQKDVIWRGITSGNTLMGHAVGSGKTFALIGIAMEKRRLGLAKKILMAEPKHLIRQVAGEFLRLYPSANILVAGEGDFTGENRKKFLSRIATGDWDAVIITHEHFEKIPVSPEAQAEIINQEIKTLEEEILLAAEMARQEGGGRRSSGSRLIKQLEKSKDKLEQKLKALMDQPKDEVLTFEELGVDQIMVDESHKFKNLFFSTKMRNIAGLGTSQADRAFDMYVKTSYLNKTTNYKGVIMATGTPVTNTMAEIFTVQRYLQPQELAERGLGHFDSWAANFGEIVSGLEIGVSGKYVVKSRFASFVNLPELLGMFGSIADIQTKEMLKLPTPLIKGGERSGNLSAPTPEYLSYVKNLGARAESIKTGKVDPHLDNMFKITSDGRDAALDMRRINTEIYAADPQGKIAKVAENVYRIWKAGAKEKHTQLIFVDRGTPTSKVKGRLNVYSDLKKKLTGMGIPAEEIKYIHDAKKDHEKIQMFKDMNRGKIRVLIGSTPKMGEGMNAQQRLKALHHLDVPWTPGLLEQREGRILRQGNENEEVELHAYVTQGSLTELSFDAYMWQTLETKANFVEQVMQGNPQIRRMEDISGGALSFAEMKAIATGNPIVLEKTRIDKEVRELHALRNKFLEGKADLEKKVATLPQTLESLKTKEKNIMEDLETVNKNRAQEFEISIGGKVFTDRETAGTLINEKATRLPEPKTWDEPTSEKIGTFYGLDLSVQKVKLAGTGKIERHVFAEGNLPWRASASESDLGTIASLNYAVSKNVAAELKATQESIERSERDLKDAREQLGKKWGKQERMAALEARQKEIDTELEKGKQDTQDLGEGGDADVDAAEIPVEEDQAAEDAAEDAAPLARELPKKSQERKFYRYLDREGKAEWSEVLPEQMRDVPPELVPEEWKKYDLKINKIGDAWVITEGRSGLAMATGSTRKELLEQFQERAKSATVEFVDGAIEKAIEMHGLSPRYSEEGGDPEAPGDGPKLYSTPLDPELIKESFQSLNQSIEELKDARRLAKAAKRTDLKWFNNAVNTPYYVFTQKFPQFAPVFERMRSMMQERDDIASELAERGLDYFAALELSDKEPLNKILIKGRYERKVFTRPELLAKGLTEAQADGYFAIRDMLDHALEVYEDGIIYRVTKGQVQSSSNIPLEVIKDILIDLEFPEERAQGVIDILDKIREAKRKGYVPFTRFGDWAYGLQRVNEDGSRGELYYYSTEESAHKAARGYQKMLKRFHRSIAAGKMVPIPPRELLQKEKKDLLQGIGGFELEILTQMMALEPETGEKLKEAVEALFQEKGFRKHFFESKDTPGFSTDMERALADYIIGLSGFVARTKGIPEIDALASGTKRYPKLALYYRSWRDYVTSPHEEFHRLRSGLFLYFLGGNPKSAAINLTQILTATLPWLTQYVSEPRALKEITWAIKTVVAALGRKPDGAVGVVLEKLPKDVQEIVRRGVREGVISEQMIFEFMGIARKPTHLRKLSKQKQRLVRGFGFMFSLAEKMNRFVTIIAAARIHKSLKQKEEAAAAGGAPPKEPPKPPKAPPGAPFEDDSFEFGKRAVDETQFIYAKFNRPRMFRNLGALLGTFRSFVINYLELLMRLWNRKSYRSVMAAFVSLWFFAGIKGLPFAEDIKRALEMIVQAFTHKKPDLETAAREWGYDNLGSADFMDYLISGPGRRITGVDIGRSVGTGEIIPLLGPEWEDPLSGIIGAPAEVFIKRPARGYQYAMEGKYARAVETVAPEFLRNPLYAARMAKEGILDRSGGAIVPEKEIEIADVFKKGLGFMPTKVSKAYEREEAKRNIGQRTSAARRDITREMLNLIREGNTDQAMRVMRTKTHGYRPKSNPDNIIFTGLPLPKSSADWIVMDERYLEQAATEAKLGPKWRGILRFPTLQRPEFLKMNKLYQ